jgi:hypothetical protein
MVEMPLAKGQPHRNNLKKQKRLPNSNGSETNGKSEKSGERAGPLGPPEKNSKNLFKKQGDSLER